MSAPRNRLRAALAERGTVIGPWHQLTDPAATELLARAGLDFVALDAQHGPHDLATIGPLLRQAEQGALAVVVRVAASEPWQIQRALDLGASAVVVPMVNDAVEAAAAVAALRYPPLGTRSFGPHRVAPGDPFDPADGPLLFAMIETAAGLANLDAIAAVPGLDGVFVGPIDLALALGEMPDGVIETALASARTAAAVSRIADAARQHGVLLAGAVFSAAHATTMAGLGMRVLIQGSDTQWIAAGAASALASTAALPGRRP